MTKNWPVTEVTTVSKFSFGPCFLCLVIQGTHQATEPYLATTCTQPYLEPLWTVLGQRQFWPYKSYSRKLLWLVGFSTGNPPKIGTFTAWNRTRNRTRTPPASSVREKSVRANWPHSPWRTWRVCSFSLNNLLVGTRRLSDPFLMVSFALRGPEAMLLISRGTCSDSEAWEPPQFQEKRSQSEEAILILGALGEFRGILGAALGVQKMISRNEKGPILGMVSRDFGQETKHVKIGHVKIDRAHFRVHFREHWKISCEHWFSREHSRGSFRGDPLVCFTQKKPQPSWAFSWTSSCTLLWAFSWALSWESSWVKFRGSRALCFCWDLSSNAIATFLWATLGAIPRNFWERTREIFICPCILGAFLQELGWSPRARAIVLQFLHVWAFSGLEEGVITKGVFSLEESLESLNSLEPWSHSPLFSTVWGFSKMLWNLIKRL